MKIEITLKEASEILGVSENTILKQWKKCEDKALKFGIVKEGRGKNAVYIQTIPEDKNKISYDILREFLINECNFDTRTDFDKLIHYLYLLLLNSTDEDEKYTYNNISYIDNIGIAEKNLIHYRKKLTDSGYMKQKKVSKGRYAYLDTEGVYHQCKDSKLYDNFNKCVVNEAKSLLKGSYILDLTQSTDYQKAKDIIEIDFDIKEIKEDIQNLNYEQQKQYIKDIVNHITFKNDMEDISRYYKIAYYEVSKSWQEELGIVNVKFYPNHMLSDIITNDIEFTNIIKEAYIYIKNKNGME